MQHVDRQLIFPHYNRLKKQNHDWFKPHTVEICARGLRSHLKLEPSTHVHTAARDHYSLDLSVQRMVEDHNDRGAALPPILERPKWVGLIGAQINGSVDVTDKGSGIKTNL